MPKNSCGYRENSTSTEYNIYDQRTHGDQEMIINASIKYRWASCQKLYNAGEFDGSTICRHLHPFTGPHKTSF